MSPEPSYLRLDSAELARRIEQARSLLQECCLCPQRCRANRQEDATGRCGGNEQALVAEFGPHPGEEAPLSGWRGSGTIFFAGCNLACVYCQNYDISHRNEGCAVDANQLAAIMVRLQKLGCHNVNLVSPSHVVAQILAALPIAISSGLRLPLVYNSGGYDCLHTLALLDSVVDIYMPDMKYGDNQAAKTYSGVSDYVEVNQAAVKAMHEQVGNLRVDDHGIAWRGLLIRHLLLPNDLSGTDKVLAFIAEQLGPDTYVNLMDQYSPHFRADEHPPLRQRVSTKSYQKARRLAETYGLDLG